MPRIYPAASLPARYGSSEKYSKLRPHSGLRFILSPGPNTTDTSCAAASSPKAAPISSPSAASQLFATADAVGKQVAGTAGIQPQVVALARLLAQAVGTVRQPDLRDAVFGHTPCFEGFRAGKRSAFFFQGQFFQQKFCILHMVFPSHKKSRIQRLQADIRRGFHSASTVMFYQGQWTLTLPPA